MRSHTQSDVIEPNRRRITGSISYKPLISDISVLIVCNKTGGTIKGDLKKNLKCMTWHKVGSSVYVREYRISTLLKVPLQKHRQGPFDEMRFLCSSTVLYSGTYKVQRPDGSRSTAVDLEEWRRCPLRTLYWQCIDECRMVQLYIVVIATWWFRFVFTDCL